MYYIYRAMFKLKIVLFFISLITITQCNSAESTLDQVADKSKKLTSSAMHLKLIEAARSQVGKTVSYDPAYVSLKYPNGDLPINKGVCTDVIIRALRDAYKFDLQKEVHLDMKSNFSKYPKIWGLKRTDRSIDHRRVPNLAKFMKRKGWSVPVSKKAKDYKPGDIVVTKVSDTLPHIIIVSDKVSSDGTPLIIHNIGSGAEEENGLFSHKIEGHFRIPIGTFK